MNQLSISANTTTADARQRGFPSKKGREGENSTVKKGLTEFDVEAVPKQ